MRKTKIFDFKRMSKRVGLISHAERVLFMPVKKPKMREKNPCNTSKIF